MTRRLNQLWSNGQVIGRHVNTTGQPLTFKIGTTIITYTGIDTRQFDEDEPLQWMTSLTLTSGVLAHLD